MSLRAAALALSFCAFAADAAAAPKTSGAVSVKGGEGNIEKRGKKPLGHVLARHLDMAVAIDAQSKTLEAQLGAVSSRYATTRSITPGSPYLGGTQRNAVGGNLRDYNETEVEAGLPLWLPGQRDAMEATVSTGVIEIEEKMGLRRLDVAGLLRDAWWNAQRAAREVNVAKSRVTMAREIGADMTRRVELGDAAQGDALLAKNELLAAETELAQAEGAEKVARVTYAALTGGAPPDGALETVKPAGDIEDHPALRTPLAALRRAETQLQLVEATPIDNPDIGVFGRQEHNRQYSTDTSQPITDQLTNATTVGVRIRIPLPTDGRQAPRRAEAEAEMTRARAEYEKAKRVILAEIKAARVNLAAARKASGLAAQRLSVANEQFDLSRKSFALGEINAFDLYRVRQLQLDAQRAQAAASVAVGQAASRVNQAQGYAP
ncbi:TolC family protein [Methylocystis parvus]|uniref:TolC family protein n=1 Tax=Methylocystis parvus TaxID=134 RepID=A0A6B8MCI0_9HYPH|nr:TolC family protein [Methylocystis parvus]QGM98360.1 TolC family protein [Methylocystis parvus]WBK01312.1 TolC family protein [Methylocystis parvus OBBP]